MGLESLEMDWIQSRQVYFGKRWLKMRENSRLWLDQVSIVSQQKTWLQFPTVHRWISWETLVRLGCYCQLIESPGVWLDQVFMFSQQTRIWLDQVSLGKQYKFDSRWLDQVSLCWQYIC